MDKYFIPFFFVRVNEIFLINPIDVFFQTKKQIEINTFINNIFKEHFEMIK